MDNIIQSPIVEEIEQSFLDYSLSVITDRAIPAVEDGLKPVMRRILWCMQESGYTNDKNYVKCARPVGDTMGKYHPHGDSSIYGALVGASQPWNMRYPLIEFHGNNGSRDGDPPAAMRYTECRLSKISEATLNGIKKNTVDWNPNFDETAQEPVYLPGVFPNLLCNGTTGIAVAMACNFAPHNLTEVMNAIIAYIKGEKDTSSLLNYISGPDFPTGGLIINKNELCEAYKTGKGKVRIRGEYKIEKDKLVFTSIPYKVSKEELITAIDNLCEEGKLTGITEIRDESNKNGVRFVIIPQKNTDLNVLANRLYELTDLETTFSINMVGLINKTPKQLTLVDIIKYYCDHQENVLRRLNEYKLHELESRIHILEGLCKALDDIDNVVALIKSSANKAAAHAALIKRYNFSSAQADAILAMTLSRLANMEKIALEQELEDKNVTRGIILKRLTDRETFTTYMIDYLTIFKDKFGDARRTTITNIEVTKEQKEIAKIAPEDVVVIITKAGTIKRIPIKNFKLQKRNGKGIKVQDGIVLKSIKTNTIDIILAFSNKGKVYRIGVDTIPEGTSSTKGVDIGSLIELDPGEIIVTATSVARDKNAEEFVWFVTKQGLIKKTNIAEYVGNKRKAGIQALSLRDNDSLINVWISNNTDILLITEKGLSIRFDGIEISPSGRTASGVQGIKLNTDDYVAVGMGINSTVDNQIFIGCSDGSGKRCLITEFIKQKRAGKGLKVGYIAKIVAGVENISDTDSLLVNGDSGAICIKANEIPLTSRIGQPVKIIKGSKLITATKVNND